MTKTPSNADRRVDPNANARLARRSFLGRSGALAGTLATASLPATLGVGTSIAGAQATKRPITIGISQEPATLGYFLNTAFVSAVVRSAIGSQPTLTIQNEKNEWIPWLAESVPSLENGGARLIGEGADQRLQVTFSLRKDVTWSDGQKLTSGDVKFAWGLIVNPDYPVPDRARQVKVASIETPDDWTVVANFLSEAEARDAAVNGRNGLPERVFADFAKQSGPVLDPGYYKDFLPAFPRHVLQPIIEKVGVAELPRHEINRKPVGIGPYLLTEWAEGQFISLTAVKSYFLGTPKTPAITVRIVTDTNSIIAQLGTGDLDVVGVDALSEFSAPELDKLANQKIIRAHYPVGGTWERIDLNFDNEHLGQLPVRKALIHAINRQQIVDKVLNGKTKVIHSWVPEWRWDYNPEVPTYDYSPDKAKALLKEAGYVPGPDGILAKGGKRLSLRYGTTAGNQTRLLVTQLVQADLKAIGVEVLLEYVPSSQWFAAGDNPGPLWGRTFELGEYAGSTGDDPLGGKNLYSTGAIPAASNGYVGSNFAGWKDRRNDALLTEAESIIDQARRRELYAEQQLLWAAALPQIPLYARAEVAAANYALQNFRPAPTNTPPTWNSHEWSLDA